MSTGRRRPMNKQSKAGLLKTSNGQEWEAWSVIEPGDVISAVEPFVRLSSHDDWNGKQAILLALTRHQ